MSALLQFGKIKTWVHLRHHAFEQRWVVFEQRRIGKPHRCGKSAEYFLVRQTFADGFVNFGLRTHVEVKITKHYIVEFKETGRG